MCISCDGDEVFFYKAYFEMQGHKTVCGQVSLYVRELSYGVVYLLVNPPFTPTDSNLWAEHGRKTYTKPNNSLREFEKDSIFRNWKIKETTEVGKKALIQLEKSNIKLKMMSI